MLKQINIQLKFAKEDKKFLSLETISVKKECLSIKHCVGILN